MTELHLQVLSELRGVLINLRDFLDEEIREDEILLAELETEENDN